MKGEKRIFWNRVLAKVLVFIMVFSMLPVVSTEAAGSADALLTLTFTVNDAEGPVEGASITVGTENGTTDAAGTATVAVTVSEDGSVDYTVEKDGYDSSVGTVPYTYTPADGEADAIAEAESVIVTLTAIPQPPSSEDVTITVAIADAEIIAVEIDGVSAAENDGVYTATVSPAESHTAVSLIQKADGSYGTVTGTGAGTITLDETTFTALEETASDAQFIELNSTSEHTEAVDDQLLVKWDALNLGTTGSVTYTVIEDSFHAAVAEETGLLFSKPGTVTIKVLDFVKGDTISASALTAAEVTVTVTSITVDGKSPADLSNVQGIVVDSNKLNQHGILLETMSNCNQLISYAVFDCNGAATEIFEITDGKLTVSQENMNAAVGIWYLAASVPGNDTYQSGTKFAQLIVAEGAAFEKAPTDMTWLSQDLQPSADGKNKTYSNPVVDPTSSDWTYRITAVYNHEAEQVTDSAQWSDTAEIDTTTGVITMKTAGKVTVQATSAGGDIVLSYDLVVWKADIAPVFTDTVEGGENTSYGRHVSYGMVTDDYVFHLKAKHNERVMELPEDADITWTVSDTNELHITEVKSVSGNSAQGQAFMDGDYKIGAAIGTANITAAVADNGRYFSSDPITYELVVDYADYEDGSCVMPNSANWYIPIYDEAGNITVTAAEQVVFSVPEAEQETYTLSLDGAVDGNWVDSITLADIVKDAGAEGSDVGNGKYIYVRNQSGAISYIKLPGYQLDQSAPELTVTYSQPVHSTLLDGMFAAFFNGSKNPLTITLAAADSESDINGVYWAIGDNGAYSAVNPNKRGEYIVSVNQNISKEVLKFKAVNGAGLTTETTDAAINKTTYKKPVVIVDTIAPKLTVSFKGNNGTETADGFVYADEAVTATITVDDQYFDAKDPKKCTVQVNHATRTVAWKTDGNKHYASITLDPKRDKDISYELSVNIKDIAENPPEDGTTKYGVVKQGVYTSKKIIIDSTTPTAKVSYNAPVCTADQNGVISEDGSTVVYNKDITVTVAVAETYFDPNDCVLTVNGKKITQNNTTATIAWKNNTAKITIPAKADSEDYYNITLTGTDIVKHPFRYTAAAYGTGNDAKGTYTSETLLIDTKAPEVVIAYQNTENSGAQAGFYTARSAMITVRDASVDPDIKGNYSISGVNAKGDVTDTDAALSEWASENAIWTSNVQFKTEANYTFGVDITDNAGNLAKITASGGDQGQNIRNEAGSYSTQFTVDATPPEITFSYSQGVLETIISGIFYRFYSEPQPLELTVTAEDNVSGVYTMRYSYDCASDTSGNDLGYAEHSYGPYSTTDGVYSRGYSAVTETAAYSGTDGQLHGAFSYAVMDYAGNLYGTGDTQHTEQEHNVVGSVREVVDSISPTATVTYGGYQRLYDGVYYYSTNSLSIPLQITEENFYPEDVEVSISKNDGDFVRVTDLTWSDDGAIHETSIILPEANNYYSFQVVYKDRSDNSVQLEDQTAGQNGTYSYTSPKLVLDTIAPVINVSYSGSYRQGSQRFYNSTATATITVYETNFLTEEATAGISITAKNIDNDGATQPAIGQWVSDGDVHTCTISYSNDARYTFDIAYTDLAVNSAEDYAGDSFTVDKTSPSNLSISYSADVWGQTTGSTLWYNSPVTVTLSATDLTAGVETISYTYTTAAGVSTVNAGGNGSESVNWNASNGTYSFTIPSAVLNEANQFNGSISFQVTDRAGNEASYDDAGNVLVVVDNIAPVITMEHDEPVSEKDDTQYYDDEFTTTIQVDEANFDPDEIEITITKDEKPFDDFTYSFQDQSGDTHEATITLDQDGEYTITVEYQDMSQNDLQDAEDADVSGKKVSNLLILDTSEPQIEINTRHNNEGEKVTTDQNTTKKAYDDDVITLMVSADDEHMLAEDVDVQLKAFLPKDASADDITAYSWNPQDIGKVEGKDGSYSIETDNLVNDAVYQLSCNAVDQSGNAVSQEIMFSINRNGSTYYVDQATSDLLSKYYTNESSEVVIHEISVEQLGEKNVTVVRDSSSKSLEENQDFVVENRYDETDEVWNDRWNEYTYTVFDSNFVQEGAYTVQTGSMTQNKKNSGTEKQYSSGDNIEVSFIMDTTAPEANISGIVDGGVYNSSKQDLVITLMDNTKLASAQILVNEQVVQEIPIDDTFDGQIPFTMGESNRDQTVRVVASDLAGNRYDDADSALTVRITSNVFFLYLEYFIVGIIILAALLAILIAVVISRKKRKNKMYV